VQEALTNVLKHAGQAHADVRLRYGAETLELEVVDDGIATGNGQVGGHGLAGMRERARVFGGDLEAGSRPEGGFSVRVWLPFEGHRT
jgi:signal transduction histidine kinase